MRRDSTRRWGMALCVVLVVLGATGTVVADEPAEDDQSEGPSPDDPDVSQEAEAHYRMAIQLFGEGRYRESVEEFDRALELHDDPVIHCNRAIPLIELGYLDEAHASLVACRDGYPSDSRDYGEVGAEVRALEVTLESIRPQTIETIDDIVAAESADPHQEVEPPQPEVADDPYPSEPTDESGMSWVRIAALISAGVGLGTGGAAAIVDWQSGDLVEEYRQQSQGGEGTSRERHAELRERIEMRQQMFWALTGVGAGAMAAGIGLWSWDLWRSSGDEATVSVAPRSGGLEAVWRLHF